jgi:hypothetical protein
LAGSPGDAYYRWPEALWSAPLVPFIFMAMLHGLASLKKKFQPDRLNLVYTLLILTGLSNVFVSIDQHPQVWSNLVLKEVVDEIKTTVPRGAAISTNVFPTWVQLSQSFKLTIFPLGLDKADIALIEYPLEHFPGSKGGGAPGLTPGQQAPPDQASAWEPIEKRFLEKLNNSSEFLKISDTSYRSSYRLVLFRKVKESFLTK